MHLRVIVVVMGSALLACVIPSMAGIAVRVEEKPFSLSDSPDSRETLSFRMHGVGKIRLLAKWTGPASSLALILNGPGVERAYARQDGRSVLRLEYQVTPEDADRGDAWTASIHNFTHRGPVRGTLRAVCVFGPSFSYDFLGDYPRDREPGWSTDCQGLAHDATHWYVTQMGRLWKFPVGFDLNREASGTDPAFGTIAVGIPPSVLNVQWHRTAFFTYTTQDYDHFGDPDWYDGRLFVPLEDSKGRHTCKILVFNPADLGYISAADLTHQSHAPWCAINPADGLLYSSNFDGVLSLSGYSLNFRGDQLALVYTRSLALRDEYGEPLRLDAVQGGAFSERSGLLYLVSDTGTGSSGGIHVFDARTGVKVGRVWIDYSYGLPNCQELEGIAVWNLDDGRAPGVRGQIHTVMIENDIASADDLWIKHHRVPLETAVESAPPSLRLAQFPPVAPVVSDEGEWTRTASSLRVSWIVPPSAGSPPPTEYQYQVRDRDTGVVRGWTSVGAATSASIELPLLSGHSYSVEVKARNEVGWSEVGTSDGIIADLRAPRTGINSFVQTRASPLGPHREGSPIIYPNSFRASLVGTDTGGSGFSTYMLSVTERTLSKPQTSGRARIRDRLASPALSEATVQIMRTEVAATDTRDGVIVLRNLPLYHGRAYTLRVRGRDQAGNVGDEVSSTCVVRFSDTTPPPVPRPRLVSSSPAKLAWEEICDPESGIADYQVALALPGEPARDWRSVGKNLECIVAPRLDDLLWRVWVKAVNGVGLESIASVGPGRSLSPPPTTPQARIQELPTL